MILNMESWIDYLLWEIKFTFQITLKGMWIHIQTEKSKYFGAVSYH